MDGAILESRDLFYCEGGSDKEYHIQILSMPAGGFNVGCQWGRRGNTLQTQVKLVDEGYDKAKKLFDKVVAEKVGKGYQDMTSEDIAKFYAGQGMEYSPALSPIDKVKVSDEEKKFGADLKAGFSPVKDIAIAPPRRKILWRDEPEVIKPVSFIPQLLNPIDESELEKYLKDDTYGMQEKKDGRHQMIRVANGMTVYNKKGKEIGYPGAWVASLTTPCVLDGEAIGEVFHTFDLLEIAGEDYRGKGYGDRWTRLGAIAFGKSIKLVPLAVGYEAKKALYDSLKKAGKEGVVFKKLSASYKPGRPNIGGDMVKFKFVTTASVRVAKGREGKRSIGMEILNGDKWEFIGNCTIPPNKDVPLSGVAEIRYLYVQGKGGHLYQPFYIGLRDDVDENECVIKQLKYKAEEE